MPETERCRNFGFLLWQESAPENWRYILRNIHVPCAVSPLHNRDLYDDDGEDREDGTPAHKAGELKKPHRHCMLMFDGKKSARQVLKYLEPLGIKWVELIADSHTYGRYFCHLDEPQQDVEYPKFIYEIADIEYFCGASLDLSKRLSGEELKRVRSEVVGFIRDNLITEYSDVVNHAFDFEPDWQEYVCNHTVFLQGYLASVRGKFSLLKSVQNDDLKTVPEGAP